MKTFLKIFVSPQLLVLWTHFLTYGEFVPSYSLAFLAGCTGIISYVILAIIWMEGEL